jgi:hypothetical protein
MVAENKDLKNEFRNEVKKQEVSPAELLRRDKLVMLKQLQVRKVLVESDRVHLAASLETLKDFAAEIAEIGDCEGKEGVIVNLKQQVESLVKQIEQCKLPRREEISLMLLEAEQGGNAAKVHLVDDNDELEDEQV